MATDKSTRTMRERGKMGFITGVPVRCDGARVDRAAAGRSRRAVVVAQAVKAEYISPVRIPSAVPLQAHCRECDNLSQIWSAVIARHGDLVALVDPLHGPKKELTFTQFGEKINQSAATLQSLGLEKGQCVSVFAENSLNWLLLDQGIIGCGGINAVRGASAPVAELKYIYENSDSVALAVQNQKLLSKLESQIDGEKVKFVVVLQGDKGADGAFGGDVPVYDFEEFMKMGESAPAPQPDVGRDDVATILYTSGTTGKPKGVPLTHGNLLYQLGHVTIGDAHPAPGDLFLSILPCWHIFERTIEYIALSMGSTLTYSSVKNFKSDLGTYKPTILVGVPRLFESLYNTCTARFNSGSELRRKVIESLRQASEEYVRARRILRGEDFSEDGSEPDQSQKLQAAFRALLNKPIYDIAELVIWRAVRVGLGGRLKVSVVGGGSLPMYLEEFYDMVKVPVLVGYGLSETSPVIANRQPGHNVPGTIGLSPPYLSMKIVDPESRQEVSEGSTGVLMAKGPPVFGGYHKMEEATSKVFDDEGYFDTGDLAVRLPNGDLKLVGRQKDIIVLLNGENVAPQPLEDTIVSSPLIDQVMLCGQDERYLTALVVPNTEALADEKVIDADLRAAAESAIESDSDEEVEALEAKLNALAKSVLLTAVQQKVRGMPEYIPDYKVMDASVVLRPFTVENGMMTQTLKTKKHVVAQVYSDKILKLYEKA